MATLNYSEPVRNQCKTGISSTDRFYSVEVKFDNSQLMYQFKIWKIPATPDFVLIKQGSDVMNLIRPGDVFRMTYYSTDTTHPKQQLPTRIVNIHRQDEGRFKGHYIVTLGILEN